MILFTEKGLYLVAGDGPDRTGVGGFIGPRKIQSDGGCIERNSVLSSPIGTFFRSSKGFLLLDRTLVVQPIGSDVEDVLDSTDQVLSGTLVPNRSQCRWLVFDGTSTYFHLIYDYERKAWTKCGTSANRNGVSSTLIDGQFSWVSGRSVRYETEGTYSIGDPVTIETGWIQLDDLEGYFKTHRIHLLAKYWSGHVTVEVAYDHEDTFSQSTQWTQNVDLAAYSGGDAVSFPIVPARMKCKAFKLRITEQIYKAASAGFLQPTAVRIEWQGKSTIYKKFPRSLQR
jgi:hypothetical protein